MVLNTAGIPCKEHLNENTSLLKRSVHMWDSTHSYSGNMAQSAYFFRLGYFVD